ncbi:calcium-binding protein [Thalassospira sp. UBA1131]|uniref:calcium-binding protein n=1 Tax=Thalassospira sp. UBA1131 TaxID=1947672 RepID=UPI0025E04A31|nr:hypothetical protein [Thalassospira sp. UBA1131]
MGYHFFEENEVNYTSTLTPTGSETGNRIIGNALNNHIQGNQYVDHISGGAGDDWIEGKGGNDVLLGDDGNDRLEGGDGIDVLNGQNGNDVLDGGAGNDRLWGGLGDDQYHYTHSTGGIDTINDDKSPTGQTGFGGGTDLIWFKDASLSELVVIREGDNLKITTAADYSDQQMDSGLVIEDFFLGGDNVVEYLFDENGQGVDLTGLL